MSSGLHWLFNQQFVSTYRQYEVSFVDRLIDQFSCLQNDHYNIEGAMGMPLPPFVACFSKDILHGNMLGVADEDGRVKLIDTSKRKESSILKDWSAHSNAIFDLAWIEKESKMVTASGDQTARLWDIEKCENIGNFRGHTCSLKSIAVQPGSSRILLTGARDGNIMVWDTRCNLKNGYHTPINTICKSHERVLPNHPTTASGKKKKKKPSCQDTKQSVTAAVFLDDCHIISTGACDGAIKYWDIRKSYSNSKVKVEAQAYHVINFAGKGPRKHGFSSLKLNSTRSRMFAVCTNNIIYEFQTTNLSSRPIATYQGHLASSFYIKAAISPDDRYLLCGSGDNSAYIWRTDQPNKTPWLLSGHSGEVTSVAWSPNNGEKIVTCSDDNTFKIWRPFQNNSDPLLSSGTVSRKLQQNERTQGTQVNLQEDVLDLDIPEKKTKCHCNTLDITTNKKVRVRWNIGTVQHAKDTSSKTNVKSKPCRGAPLSPFTTITPKGSANTTPTRPLREKITNNPSSPTTMLQSPCENNQHSKVKIRTQTPTSSRVFMESWLKSPRTPDVQTPNTTAEKDNKFLFPGDAGSDRRNSPRDKTPEPDVNKPDTTKPPSTPVNAINLLTAETPVSVKQHPVSVNTRIAGDSPAIDKTLRQIPTIDNHNNLNLWYKHLKPDRSRSPSPQPSFSRRKSSTRRSKRMVDSGQQSLNIKTLLVSLKRKCESPPQREQEVGKRQKSSGDVATSLEARINSLNVSCGEDVVSSSSSLEGHGSGINKENISNNNNSNDLLKLNSKIAVDSDSDSQASTSASLQVTSSSVKDILDYAGDFS